MFEVPFIKARLHLRFCPFPLHSEISHQVIDTIEVFEYTSPAMNSIPVIYKRKAQWADLILPLGI